MEDKKMSQILDAKVIMCTCPTHRKQYGILMEEYQSGTWNIRWAFPISEQRAKSERFDKSTISGQFYLASEYPGCPYCKAPSFFVCGCGKLSCWNCGEELSTCANCGRQSRITYGSDFTFDSNGDV